MVLLILNCTTQLNLKFREQKRHIFFSFSFKININETTSFDCIDFRTWVRMEARNKHHMNLEKKVDDLIKMQQKKTRFFFVLELAVFKANTNLNEQRTYILLYSKV